MEEIEIKFVVTDTKSVTEKLRKLGFKIAVGRHRERNYLFDDGSATLMPAAVRSCGTCAAVRECCTASSAAGLETRTTKCSSPLDPRSGAGAPTPAHALTAT